MTLTTKLTANDPERDKQDWATHQALKIAEEHVPPSSPAKLSQSHELMQTIARALRRAHEDGRLNEGTRERILWFSRRMEKKLRKNDHKGHWSNCTRAYLLRRLRSELKELAAETANFGRLTKKEMKDAGLQDSARALISEAADVANFAMMLADVVAHRAGLKEP